MKNRKLESRREFSRLWAAASLAAGGTAKVISASRTEHLLLSCLTSSCSEFSGSHLMSVLSTSQHAVTTSVLGSSSLSRSLQTFTLLLILLLLLLSLLSSALFFIVSHSTYMFPSTYIYIWYVDVVSGWLGVLKESAAPWQRLSCSQVDVGVTSEGFLLVRTSRLCFYVSNNIYAIMRCQLSANWLFQPWAHQRCIIIDRSWSGKFCRILFLFYIPSFLISSVNRIWSTAWLWCKLKILLFNQGFWYSLIFFDY